MTLTVLGLLLALFVAVLVVARLVAGINLLTWVWGWLWPQRAGVRQAQRRAFAEITAARMLADERAAAAVYARTQSYLGEIGYVFTGLAFFLGVLQIDAIANVPWLNFVLSGTFLSVGAASFWALGRLDELEELDRAAIRIYEKQLGLPPRSRRGAKPEKSPPV